jgi:seryl-tRNA synthetase
MRWLLVLTFGLFLASTCGLTTQVSAQQMSKKQEKALKKQWKTKAKQYSKNPLSLKEYDETNKDRITSLEAENKKLKDQLKAAQAEAERQTAELRRMASENQDLKTAYEALKNAQQTQTPQGLIFKVQLGAFEKFNINQYLQDTENFEGESADGLNKYTVGNFRDAGIAESFRLDIRKMGIKDAWIVPFRDGVRITMTEAKEIMGAAGVTIDPPKKK